MGINDEIYNAQVVGARQIKQWSVYRKLSTIYFFMSIQTKFQPFVILYSAEYLEPT